MALEETLLLLIGKALWLQEETESVDVFQRCPDIHLLGTMSRTGRGGKTSREFHSDSIHSFDGGRTWDGLSPSIKLRRVWMEPYAQRAINLGNGSLMIGSHDSEHIDTPTWRGIACSRDQQRTWEDYVPIACAAYVEFYEVELLKLGSGRILALIRTNDPPPYDCFQSVPRDEGGTWTSPQKAGFGGQGRFLFTLNQEVNLRAYRDVAPGRKSLSLSTARDEECSGSWLGQRCRAPSFDCASLSILRLSTEQLLCVSYASYVEGNSEIHGPLGEDRTRREAYRG